MYLSLQIVVNFESAYVAILVISVRHLPSTVNYLKYLICTSITFYTSNSNVDNISTPSSSRGRRWYFVAIALIFPRTGLHTHIDAAVPTQLDSSTMSFLMRSVSPAIISIAHSSTTDCDCWFEAFPSIILDFPMGQVTQTW